MKATKIDPNNPFLNNNLGNIYNENGKLDKAISYYEKVILFKPDFVQVYLNLGIVYAKKVIPLKL